MSVEEKDGNIPPKGNHPEEQAVTKPEPPPEAYESVADYDPVLRSHCRLDREDEWRR